MYTTKYKISPIAKYLFWIIARYLSLQCSSGIAPHDIDGKVHRDSHHVSDEGREVLE